MKKWQCSIKVSNKLNQRSSILERERELWMFLLMKFKDLPDHARSIIQQMTEHKNLHHHRSLRRPFTSHYRKKGMDNKVDVLQAR
jgi:hypothetical protein